MSQASNPIYGLRRNNGFAGGSNPSNNNNSNNNHNGNRISLGSATRTSSIISNNLPFRQSLLHGNYDNAINNTPSTSSLQKQSQQQQQQASQTSQTKRRSTLLSTPATTTKRRQSMMGNNLHQQHQYGSTALRHSTQPSSSMNSQFNQALQHVSPYYNPTSYSSQTPSSQPSSQQYQQQQQQQQANIPSSASSSQQQQQSMDPRPLKDKKYQELIQKEIIRYLIDYKFEIKTNIALTENILKSPTQKNFNAIFKFLYNQLDPNYMFIKSSIEQEIVTLLKLLNYPYMHTITRSHFSAVGGNNWPTFLGILYWLVELNLSLSTLNDDDFLADDDFDKIFIEYIWKSYSLFINDEEEEEQQQQQQQQANNGGSGGGGGDKFYNDMKIKFDQLQEKLNQELNNVEQQHENLLNKYHELNNQLKIRDDALKKTVALEEDYMKLKSYNQNVEKMMPEWNKKLEQLSNEVISYEEQMNKLQDEKKSIEMDLQQRGISIDKVNELYIKRDQLSKSIEIISNKIDDLKEKLSGRSFDLEKNFDNLENLTNQYNEITNKFNYYYYQQIQQNQQQDQQQQEEEEEEHQLIPQFGLKLDENIKTTNERRQFTRDEIFLNINVKQERQNLLNFRNELDHQILNDRSQAMKFNEKCDIEQDKIKDQQSIIEELKIQDSLMKRKSDDLKQTIFQIQNEFNSQIESLDQQIRETKSNIQSDILQLERKLRDVNLNKSLIQEQLIGKRQKIDEDVINLTSFILKFKTNIQEKLINIADIVQDQLKKQQQQQQQASQQLE